MSLRAFGDTLRAFACQSVPLSVGLALLGCDPNLPIVTDEIPVESGDFRPVGPAEENESSSLLQTYADRPALEAAEADTWMLPYQSKRIGVALLIAAAHGRLSELKLVLTPDVKWGLPDRRMIEARPVFDGDGGRAFMHALRTAAQRFASDATWTSKPVQPAVEAMHTFGAEPMWTYWRQGRETLLLRLVVVQGRARIDYVGLWEGEPQPDLDISAYGVAPPFTPPPTTRRPPPPPPGMRPPRPVAVPAKPRD